MIIDHDDHRRLSEILSGRNGAMGMEVASQSSLHNSHDKADNNVIHKPTSMASYAFINAMSAINSSVPYT